MKRGKRERLRDLSYIFARNVLLLTNGIIFLVCLLLYVFGDVQAAIFLGIILFINMTLGLGQDIRSWLKLEELQFLTAPRVTRIKDGKEEVVPIEEIVRGDHIKLKIGDQIPCDGILLSANAFELNEGLITGESTSFPRKNGESVLAGSIVTSGTGIMESTSVYHESRMARMTEGVKSYSVSMSPIQKEVALVIKYSGYILFLIIAYVIIRGTMVNEPSIEIVKNIGALASLVVPQGLAFAMTLLFAYGAGHLFNRNVLLQEISATEKLGRIRNLCMDKTGTLTENTLIVDEMLHPKNVTQETIKEFVAAYLNGSEDSSVTGTAVREYLDPTYSGEILDAIAFSSWRSYGGVKIKRADLHEPEIVLVGAPDVFLGHLSTEEERQWLRGIIDEKTNEGKRLLLVVRTGSEEIPKDLTEVTAVPIAIFVLSSKLRPGINDAVNFFQKRGVHLRIISGDDSNTVRSIAMSAGVNDCNKIITGAEMSTWSDADFDDRTKEYTIFARTIPEQKERIIESLRKDGFTAMVGDGANDALAIKKADLGIAMFDGAPATRQLASVVLTNNSFTALPKGVELADSIIKNAEIFAGLFFTSGLSGFFLFIILALSGNSYQLTPLNVTLINYFVVGIPGLLISYWTIKPAQKLTTPSDGKFLPHVLPFVVLSALAQSIAISIFFFASPAAMRAGESNLLVIIAFILTGIGFFLFAPTVYRGKLTVKEYRELWTLSLLLLILLPIVLNIPLLLRFFEVTIFTVPPSLLPTLGATIVLYTLAQFAIAKNIRTRKERGAAITIK